MCSCLNERSFVVIVLCFCNLNRSSNTSSISISINDSVPMECMSLDRLVAAGGINIKSNELFWLILCFDNVDLCHVLNRFCSPLEVLLGYWTSHGVPLRTYCFGHTFGRLIFILIHTSQLTLKLLEVIFVINFTVGY